MNMQGGAAPPDARDPNTYSNGYTLHSGAYALPGGHEAMEMGDAKNFAALLVDRLERSHSSQSNATAYELQAWYGSAFNKLTLKAEGEVADSRVEEARTELLWSRAFATFWDTQVGVRNDTGHDTASRNWLAFGVQGLAPYWFEVDATAYVGQHGRTALRLSAEYELLLTQRLILQPRIEANLYGKEDTEAEVGRGLSNGTAGLRLRYEFSRQFAPYIGVERQQYFGDSADFVQAAGGRRGETRVVAGVRLWF
ncbi:MAG: copper resistance protein B [Rhodocyclaceae bacterium]|nr:copper resistance protein B [Rhodocyclaceae bacterium]